MCDPVIDFFDDATGSFEEFLDDAISDVGPEAAADFILPGTGTGAVAGDVGDVAISTATGNPTQIERDQLRAARERAAVTARSRAEAETRRRKGATQRAQNRSGTILTGGQGLGGGTGTTVLGG